MPLKDAGSPVASRQPTIFVLRTENAGGAKLSQAGDVRILEILGAPAGQFGQCLPVSDLGALVAADGNRLEVLGAHDRAHARTPGGPIAHTDDGCKSNEVLAGWPALQDLDLGVAQLLLDRRLGLAGHLAP